MMRLDKLLTSLEIGTRSEVKEFLKKGKIQVNGQVMKKPDDKVDEFSAVILYAGKEYRYVSYEYYKMHKPAGYITATEDAKEPTVMEVFGEKPKADVVPVGRLDKDTEGILIFTNHGQLSHFLLHPKRHVDKTYEVTCEKEVTIEMMRALELGVDIGEETKTLPAKVERMTMNQIALTIHEGKFHQVKRMLEAVGNKVIYLKRTQFGPIGMDGIEEKGMTKPLTNQEIGSLFQAVGLNEMTE